MKKSTIGLFLILILLGLACFSTPGGFETQFEPQPASLEIFRIERLEVYVQDQPIFVDMDELLIAINDPQFLENWNKMLGTCETHRPNHPKYTDHYLIVAYHENGHQLYELTVDSEDGNKIDMSPIKTEVDFDFSVTYELGLYRCEGLREIVNEITAQ